MKALMLGLGGPGGTEVSCVSAASSRCCCLAAAARALATCPEVKMCPEFNVSCRAQLSCVLSFRSLLCWAAGSTRKSGARSPGVRGRTATRSPRTQVCARQLLSSLFSPPLLAPPLLAPLLAPFLSPACSL